MTCCTIDGATVRPVCQGVYHGKAKPYVRRTSKTRSKAQDQYTKSSALLGGHLLTTSLSLMHPDKVRENTFAVIDMLARRGDNPGQALTAGSGAIICYPYLFGLAIDCPPVKSGVNKGLPSAAAGDFDNFIKAFLDTARWIGLVPEDSLRWFRGIVMLDLGFRDPVSISEDGGWHFTWSFFRSLEP